MKLTAYKKPVPSLNLIVAAHTVGTLVLTTLQTLVLVLKEKIGTKLSGLKLEVLLLLLNLV
jgi:hypothetical protein